MDARERRLRRQYANRRVAYEGLEGVAVGILETALKKARMEVHSVPSRVKDFKSFFKKVTRKLEEQSLDPADNPFERINDITALRVVCLFLPDIPRARKVIEESFDVVEVDDKIDGEGSEPWSFRYYDVAYIVRLKREYAGPRYDEIKTIPFEIQVRTIAMEAWASISWALDYKTPNAIPSKLRRDFYALNGMFYIADKHVELFFRARQKSRKRAAKQVERDGLQAKEEINLDTLIAYLRMRFPHRMHMDTGTVSDLAENLVRAGFRNLHQVEVMLGRAEEAFQQLERDLGLAPFTDAGVVQVSLWLVDEGSMPSRVSEHARATYAQYRHLVSD